VDGLLDDHDQGADASEDRNEAWRFLLAGGVAGAGESWRGLTWLNGVERQSWKGVSSGVTPRWPADSSIANRHRAL